MAIWMRDGLRAKKGFRSLVMYLGPLILGVVLAYSLIFLPAVPTVYLANEKFIKQVTVLSVRCMPSTYRSMPSHTTITYRDNFSNTQQVVTFLGNACNKNPNIASYLQAGTANAYGRRWFWGQIIDKVESNVEPQKNNIIFNWF